MVFNDFSMLFIEFVMFSYDFPMNGWSKTLVVAMYAGIQLKLEKVMAERHRKCTPNHIEYVTGLHHPGASAGGRAQAHTPPTVPPTPIVLARRV